MTPKKFIILFFLVNLFLSSFYLDSWHNANSTTRAIPILTFCETGSFNIDKYESLTMDKSYINGHYYCDKAPFATMLTLPFYALPRALNLFKIKNNDTDLYPIYLIGGFITGSLPFAIIVTLIMLAVIKNNLHNKFGLSPLVMIMTTLYGSLLYVFTGTLWGHLLAGVFWLITHILVTQKQKYFLAGLMLGFAFATEFAIGILFPVYCIMIWVNEKSFKNGFTFGLGLMPGFLLILGYNYYFTGSPFEMVYAYEYIKGNDYDIAGTIFGFRLPNLKNTWEIIFGQFKGILFYMPPLIYFMLEGYRQFKQPKALEILRSYFLMPVLIFVFLILAMGDIRWCGGWTFGPRYIIPAVVILTYESILFFADKKPQKLLFAITALLGLGFAFLAKVTWVYSIPFEFQTPLFDFVVPEFLKGELNENNLATYLFGISDKIAIIIWLLLYSTSIIFLNKKYKSLNNNVERH